jgi:hypothetical protein
MHIDRAEDELLLRMPKENAGRVGGEFETRKASVTEEIPLVIIAQIAIQSIHLVGSIVKCS